MMNVVCGLSFAGFVFTGLAAAFARGVRRQRFVQAFLLYSVLAGLGAGFTQRDSWPFSAWPLVAGVLPKTVTHTRLVAVDTIGAEHDVDYRAWQPLSIDELISWLDSEFPKLDGAAQERAFGFLLDRAERARLRARNGESVGTFDRLLGPLAAPYFLLHPRVWSVQVPAEAFVRLRLYRETWNLEERRQDPAKVTRVLAHEFRRW